MLASACASGNSAAGRLDSATPVPGGCEESTHPFTRWTLYFGMSRTDGAVVSDSEWEAFLRDEVTPRFPNGFTVMDGAGRWRGSDGKPVTERTKVLVLIQSDTRGIRFAVGEMVNRYKALFHQESVLQEVIPVCARF